MTVSLASQIAAVQNAASGFRPANRDQADLQQKHLQAALKTLRWVKANETTLRATRTSVIGGRL